MWEMRVHAFRFVERMVGTTGDLCHKARVSAVPHTELGGGMVRRMSLTDVLVGAERLRPATHLTRKPQAGSNIGKPTRGTGWARSRPSRRGPVRRRLMATWGACWRWST